MLKVEQEGERLMKDLNELENKQTHIKHKPTRYFNLIRDWDNKVFCDRTYFETKKRK